MTTAEHIRSLTKPLKPSSQKVNMFDPKFHDTATTLFRLKDEHGNKFKLYAYPEVIVIEISIETSLLFAINLPDTVCLANKTLSRQMGIKIFTNHSNDSAVLNCVALIARDIQELNLEDNEGLFVYGNAIQLCLKKTRALLPELSILATIKSKVANNFPDSDVEEVDASKIPATLQDIIPLLSEWAIADDEEREDKIIQSSKEELRKVVDIVSPKMSDINNYLASFKDDPLTCEATLIGNIAELVSELALMKLNP